MTGYSVLSTAVSGLTAAQRGMDITSQNIVNSNTPGYSRQILKQSAVAPALVASVHTGGNETTVGGVTVESVVRVRDQFLESTRAQAGGAKAALDAQSTAMQGIETLVNEPSDSALQAKLTDFFGAWSSLSTKAGSEAAAASGSNVIGQAKNVVSQLNTLAAGVSQQYQTQLADLKTTVGQINDYATQLAQLNQQIVTSAASTGNGAPVNELLDKRDQLVRSIAELSGGVAAIQTDGTATVAVGGATIVFGNQSLALSVAGGGAVSDVNGGNPPRIEIGGQAVGVTSGKAAGLMSSLTADLPQFANQLDSIAAALRDSVNALHATGFTATGAPGGDFFTGSSALDLSVAVSGTDELALNSAAGVDGSVAQKLGDLVNDADAEAVLGGPGALQQYRSLATSLGSKINGLKTASDVQSSILSSADQAIESNAGVNLDEEMTNLLQYQRAYQAAAKVISAIDEMMDTLINRTGI
ncbi:flagellar hook-associated protein FlgK [Spongisporangium articulatum]|uniref:Flagellar hook-associated protein 1 n=1 Tax=Spongisporangium articulatum TaxID=3362603 RepID=A0ABW8AHK7_9ACTN